MHSLKNTIVAVGLLGVSFLFYHASSNSPAETGDLIPAVDLSSGMEIADGITTPDVGNLKQLANDSMDTLKSNFGSMPKVELPKLKLPDASKAKKMVSDFGANAANEFNSKASQLKGQANDIANQFSNSFLENPNLKAPTPTPPRSQPVNTFNPNPPPVPTPRQPLGSASRDQGLIAALESQRQPALKQPELKQPVIKQPALPPSNTQNQFAGTVSYTHLTLPTILLV